uniref:Uncharacterized protein n=1 Tax=Ditylenchus dipsaci TaxID=166011 RepID=A0A915DPL7_9BILA
MYTSQFYNARNQLLSDVDSENAQNRPKHPTIHLKMSRLLKLAMLITAVVVAVLCLFAYFSVDSDADSESNKNSKSRRAISNVRPPPRNPGTTGLKVQPKYVPNPDAYPAPAPAQSPAASPQGQRNPQNQVQGGLPAPIVPLLAGSQAAQQAIQSADSEQQSSPFSRNQQLPAEQQANTNIEAVSDQLELLQAASVDWTKEKKAMQSPMRKQLALSWMSRHPAIRSDALTKFAKSMDMGTEEKIEAVRKWMGNNKHKVVFLPPTTMYDQILPRTDFSEVDFKSLPDGMKNPTRRQRMKDLLENHPDFTNAEAAEELGVEEWSVRNWIIKNQRSYIVEDTPRTTTTKRRRHDNVPDSDIPQKKLLTNALRTKNAEIVGEEAAVIVIEHEATRAEVEFMGPLVHQLQSNEITEIDFVKKTAEIVGVQLPNTPAVLEAVQNRVAAIAVASFLIDDAVPETHFGDLNIGRLTDEINTAFPENQQMTEAEVLAEAKRDDRRMQLCEADKDECGNLTPRSASPSSLVRSLASPVSDDIEDAIFNGQDVDISPPANVRLARVFNSAHSYVPEEPHVKENLLENRIQSRKDIGTDPIIFTDSQGSEKSVEVIDGPLKEAKQEMMENFFLFNDGKKVATKTLDGFWRVYTKKSSGGKTYYCSACHNYRDFSRRSSDFYEFSLPSLSLNNENQPVFDGDEHRAGCVGYPLHQVKSQRSLPPIQWVMVKFMPEYGKNHGIRELK